VKNSSNLAHGRQPPSSESNLKPARSRRVVGARERSALEKLSDKADLLLKSLEACHER